METERAAAVAAYDKPWAYVVLTKPDVTFLVVITTVAGFYLGSAGSMEWWRLAQTLCGTLLVAGGTAALNQYIERDMDSVMRRTAARPLPTGILQPNEVLWFGVATIIAGTLWLALAINALAAFLALATSVSYLAAYTPLKTRTTLATAVGASSPDWVGRRARKSFRWRLGALRDSFRLAISALHGHRLDVP